VADRVGPGAATLLVAAFAALAVEAARQALRHGRSQLQAEELREVGRAAQRVVAGGQPLPSVAEQIRVECRNLLPFVWFDFELGEARWSAGPDGGLRQGPARPGPAPPPLPGVHRRGAWEVVERDLRVEGEALARVRLWCDSRLVEPGARQLLDELLPQMAASVHRALLDREARHDALTGVASRRVLDDRLQAAFRRACDEGGSMAVILCDLDHFKAINDTWGHDAGDRALVAVARQLDERRRDGDLLCRWGGEEFALLVEGSDGATAHQLAERLRLAVEEIELAVGGRKVALTLSAGVAAFPELHAKTGAELVLLADAALYRAKQAGRNRTLLNRGGGRFADAAGTVLGGARRRPAKPPQIFA
jgi:diguanylate cyclase (GGDEF)-like protein